MSPRDGFLPAWVRNASMAAAAEEAQQRQEELVEGQRQEEIVEEPAQLRQVF